MTEADRITLLNDLCDYKDELSLVIHPMPTRALDVVSRAIAFVRGSRARWVNNGTTCNGCGYDKGNMELKFCPNCGARMQK